MRKLGEFEIGQVRADAHKGQFQNNRGNFQYRSKRYKEQKSRGFESKVKGKPKTGMFAPGKKAFGLSVNRQVDKVNMTLRGRTLRSLKIIKVKHMWVMMGWLDTEATKIVETNAKRGYDLTGLSDKNIKKAEKELATEFESQINKFAKKSIRVRVN